MNTEMNTEMNTDSSVLAAILDAYPYPVVFCDTGHVVRYLNREARNRYGARIQIGNSIFNCHNEQSRSKIDAFLQRAMAGEGEMYEYFNEHKGEREFFTPVRDPEGKVIGYFERHEVYWEKQ